MRHATRRPAWLLAPAGALVAGGLSALPAAATPTTCSTVSVSVLNTELGMAAAHVTATHPASPVGALICSYYGNSGRSANEATIDYVPATAKAFAAVETSLSASHSIRTIPGIKSGAYSYEVGSERFLYVLDGPTQIQMYATVALAKLEALARVIPLFP